MGFCKKLTIDGSSALVNLGAAMRAAGYGGGGIVSSLRIYNPSATVILYIHATNNGTTPPDVGDGTKGWPVSAGAGTLASSNVFQSDRGSNPSSIDIGTTWLYTASSIDVIVMAIGS